MTDIRELLENDVDDLPPSRVDPRRALERARAIRRRRRLAGAGTAAAVAAVAVVAGALWGGAVLPGRHAVAAGSPPASPDPAASTPAAVAPAHFDPLVGRVALGWLPGHLTGRMTEFTRAEQDVFYGEVGAGRGSAGLTVMFLAAGQRFNDSVGSAGLSPGATPVATAPVHGAKAYCLVGGDEAGSPPATCSALRWQYAPGAWAVVSYHSADKAVTDQQTAAIVRRVAENASLTAHDPVRMPFRLTGAASRLTPVRSLVDDGSPGSTELELSSQPDRWSMWNSDTAGAVDIGLELQARPTDQLENNPINNTVDGHPACVRSGSLVLYDLSGASAWFQSDDPTATYHQTQLVPHPTDRTTWVSPTG
jgi:hypothetical protein